MEASEPPNPNATCRVALIGASGYVGGELLRLFAAHPHVQVVAATSETHVGKPVRSIHPQLRGRSDLAFTNWAALTGNPPANVDVVISALPHGQASVRLAALEALAPRVIDCSADFRLDSAAAYERWYGLPHPAPERLGAFVYGLPEARRAALRGATHASGVGCNATATNLALMALVQNDLLDLDMPIIADLKVGSSEAGRSTNAGSHHPERSGVVRSFAPTGHRHTSEVEQVLGLSDVHLSVTSVEMVRGVLATGHAWLKAPLVDKDLWRAYRATYGAEPFVRIVHERQGGHRHPEPRLVTGTNFADVGWALGEVDARGRQRIVALCALDNLMKGAAGSAVQSLNLMCGFDETAGLDLFPLHLV